MIDIEKQRRLTDKLHNVGLNKEELQEFSFGCLDALSELQAAREKEKALYREIERLRSDLIQAGKDFNDLRNENTAAREKIAEQGGLISRQGIEIMNQLEEIARQAEELELLRAVFHEDYGDGGERLRYVEWLEKHRPEGIFQGNTPTSYKEWRAKRGGVNTSERPS